MTYFLRLLMVAAVAVFVGVWLLPFDGPGANDVSMSADPPVVLNEPSRGLSLSATGPGRSGRADAAPCRALHSRAVSVKQHDGVSEVGARPVASGRSAGGQRLPVAPSPLLDWTIQSRQPLHYPEHLYEAILEVEGGPPENPAQISRAYWQDAWEPVGMKADYDTGKNDHNLSKLTMFYYAYRYEPEALRKGDVFILACLHNGGWNWRKLNCADYGNRVANLVRAREQ